MPKRWTRIIIPIVVSILGILLLFSGNTNARTIEVDNEGNGDYVSIHDAVNASNDGDVVVVHEGEYHESVNITTSITITGVEGESVVMAGSKLLYSLNISSNNVNITDIVFHDSTFGILLSECTGAIIDNCEFNDCANGISLMASSGNEISNTTFSNNKFAGIMLGDYGLDGTLQGSSSNNRFLHNLLIENRNGIYAYTQGQGNIAHNNRFENNSGQGMNCNFGNGIDMDATNNWWGSPFGPYNYKENPLGKGDNVMGSVTFDPWTGKDDIPSSRNLSDAYVLRSVIENGNGSSDRPFDSITQAIYHIRQNGTIHVWEGLYFEHLVIGKSLKIIGNGSKETIIMSGVFGDCVTIQADNVEIRNLEISVSSNESLFLELIGRYPGRNNCLRIESSWNTITNCVLTEGMHGISLSQASNNTLSCNAIHPYSGPNYRDGIQLEKGSNDNSIIENFCSNFQKYGISVSTSDGNVIEGNTFSYNEIGISLSGCNRTLLNGNDCSRNSEIGIRMKNSSHSIVSHNICSSNGVVGIELDRGNNQGDQCSMNELISNECSENELAGIDLGDSSQSVLKMNTMQGCGITVGSIPLSVLEDHDIDDTNMVNGKKVVYLTWKTGIHVNGGAGQVILVNCSDIVIEDQQLDSCSIGIALYFCESITIVNSSFLDNIFGILMHNSSNNLISNNTISRNNRDFLSGGLAAFFSHNNTVSYNTISGNEIVGMGFVFSSNNSISNNTFTENSNGIIFLLDREYLEFFGVNIGEDTRTYGMNTVHYNTFNGNDDYGIVNYVGSSSDSEYANGDDSPYIVDARYNWWGNDKGPGGKGDQVSDHVEFSPWITEDGALRYAETPDEDGYFDILHPLDLLFLLLVSLSLLFTILILVVRHSKDRSSE